MKKFAIVIILLAAVAAFAIYKLTGAIGKAGDRGDVAITAFHADYNAGKTDGLYAAAAPAFRSSVSKEQFTSLMDMLHEKLGEWKSGGRTGINLESTNGNTTLEITCSAKFAKGEGTEEFVFDYNGEAPLLMGYNVKSPALIEAPEKRDAPAAAEPEKAPANP